VDYSFSFTLLHISTLLVTFIAILVFRMKQKVQIHYVFLLYMICLMIWDIGILCDSYMQMYFERSDLFFILITHMGVIIAPVSLMFLGIIFAHTKIRISWKYLLFLIVPIVSLLVLATNDFHHLFYLKYSLNVNETIVGPYFIVHAIYSYICTLVGLYYLIVYSVKNSGFFSKQSILIFIGNVVPVLINILITLKVFSTTLYVTPIAFSFSVVCYIYAIFKYEFLNVTPIALQKVVDLISDSFLVLNERLNIIDYNKTFVEIFGKTLKIKRKDTIVDLLTSNATLDFEVDLFCNYIANAREEKKSVIFEKHIKLALVDKYFTIEITPIITRDNYIGTIILFKDITQNKKDLEIIKRNQEMLIERERLASLGQLVGGIAHNLKTPIMSISGGLEALRDLINEYSESIIDSAVTIDDHREIAREMLQWIEKIKPHCAYMSDVISAVKGQAVQMNDSSTNSFTLEELVKKVEVLMKHELKIHHCSLNISLQADKKNSLVGEINSLIQTLNNIIVNAIHSYDNKIGDINFLISENEDNIEFAITDYGKGMSKEIQNRLFKEMVTTKGKNGTGLGLYMSYSTIKGHFGGKMWFESEENKGTTFYISIPKMKADAYQGGSFNEETKY